MALFHDLNLGDASLQKRALSLGFSYAKPANNVLLSSPKDFRKLGDGVNAVECKSPDLLKACLKRFAGALLLSPYSTTDFFKDDGLVRSVAHASKSAPCAFELPLAPFLSTKFVYRARLVSHTRSFLKKCVKHRAPFVFTSRAKSEWELKSPREAIAIGVFYGLSYEQAAAALSTRPAKLLEELE